MTTPARTREALLAWFRQPDHKRPPVVEALTDPDQQPPRTGTLTSTIDHGEITLFRGRGNEDRTVRLTWNPDGDHADHPARILPPGRWFIRGYRRLAQDDDGVEWCVSSSSHGRQSFLLHAGASHHLPAAPGLTLRFVVRQVDASTHVVRMAFLGSLGPLKGALTLYRDGSRVPMRFRALNADGEVCAHGDMKYG